MSILALRSRFNSAEFRSKFTGATMIVTASALVFHLLRIVSTTTLTRLLSAEDYAVIGICSSLTYIVSMLSELGFYAFVVRHSEAWNNDFLDEVWTIRLIRSALLVLVFSLLAWPAARLLSMPEVAPVVLVSSFAFLLEGMSSLCTITTLRDYRVGRLTLWEFVTALLALAVTIAFAMWLHNYWAMVLGGLSGAIARVVLSYTMFPGERRRVRFSKDRAREMWGFSRFLAASSALTLLIGQTDKLILARGLSLETFGMYTLATSIASAPGMLSDGYTHKVLFPAYAGAVRDRGVAGLAQIFYQQKRLISLFYAFAVGGLIGAAPLLVATLYDTRYAAVAPFLQLFALGSLMRLGNQAATEAMIVAGRARATFNANVVRAIWLVAGGALAVMQGHPIWIAAVVGLIEVPALAFFWPSLWRLGILRLKEELLVLLLAAAGLAVGWAATIVLLPLIRVP